MILWAFLVLAIFGISAAYLLKVHLSGSDLSYAKFYSCLVFNGFFVIPYMEILQNDDFLFDRVPGRGVTHHGSGH